jgi:hypothetical protein
MAIYVAAGGCAECHAEPLAKCNDVKSKDESGWPVAAA